MIDLYIKHANDLELRSDDLGTPMDWAVAYGQLNAAKHLLSKGSKIITENPSSNIPPGIHLAINTNNTELAHFLLDSEEKCYSVKDSQGWSTLHLAGEAGNLSLCEKLAKKVDPNYKCQDQTALDLAF